MNLIRDCELVRTFLVAPLCMSVFPHMVNIGRFGLVRKILKPDTWKIAPYDKGQNQYCIVAYSGYRECNFLY